MAQRDQEEAELRVPETLTLCANNCGFHGNPATKNMCQICFQAAVPPSCSGHKKMARSGPIRPAIRPPGGGEAVDEAGMDDAAEAAAAEAAAAPAKEVRRCAGCRRRVGLTAGFRCRCGEVFCAEHRYTDRHECSFDYKAAGRDAITRENPLVRAAKIVRI